MSKVDDTYQERIQERKPIQMLDLSMCTLRSHRRVQILRSDYSPE